jgi:hypothetical protein
VAVPLDVGVPVIVYVNEPAPLASVPAARVAVKPTTPVELMLWAAYEPPFPPVYGTLMLTPLAAVPEVSVPVWVEVPQLRSAKVADAEQTPAMVTQVKLPLHIESTCPFMPGFKVTQALPFQCIS